MKMNELKLVYFSPTGATRKAVMETARNIDLKSVSFDFSVYKEKRPALKFAPTPMILSSSASRYTTGACLPSSWIICRTFPGTEPPRP